MARWSSSASELVDRPAASDDAAQAEPLLIWTLRPGFIAGSPWPRAAALILLGLPTLVVLFWVAAWLGAMPALLLGAIVLAVFGGVWSRQQQLASLAPLAANPPVLIWQGPWPGQAVRAARAASGGRAVRAAQPTTGCGTDADTSAVGFLCDGQPVWPRIRLQWGAHLCLQCTDRDWAWLTVRDHPADRALRVLLHTLSVPGADSTPQAAGSHTGGSVDAMASCEAWDVAVARRRAQAQAKATGGEARDDFPATAIMKYDTGTELEPRRPHG
jgi:hypothetical protein